VDAAFGAANRSIRRRWGLEQTVLRNSLPSGVSRASRVASV